MRKTTLTLQRKYAESAADAATKAGDTFALQTALLQMLSAQMRIGDVEGSLAIERRLAKLQTDDLADRYLTLFRAVRFAWDGRFRMRRIRLLSTCWTHA